MRVMTSSARDGDKEKDEWATPHDVFNDLDREFGFDCDVAANHENAKCDTYFTEEEDGLRQDWSRFDVVFMNPPYSQVEDWMRKAFIEAQNGVTVVCLVPSRTSANWWHRYAMKGEIRFCTSRLKFRKPPYDQDGDSAPFPSAIVVMNDPPTAQEKLTAYEQNATEEGNKE